MKWFKRVRLTDPTADDGDFVPLTPEENACLCKVIAIVGGISIAFWVIIIVIALCK